MGYENSSIHGCNIKISTPNENNKVNFYAFLYKQNSTNMFLFGSNPFQNC